MGTSRQRILIVDDSKIVRTTFARLIRGTFDVREEVDGEAAWNAVQSDPAISVVISDLSMPKLDGFGLLQRIRSSQSLRVRDLPVIMISGNEDDDTKSRARSAGASDFIAKSSDGVEILTRIENLLRLVQTKQDLDASREALKLNDANDLWDPITGAFTGEYLTTEGGKHYSHARRHGSSLAVVSFRIENYFEISDRIGSKMAEVLLARITKLVQSALRAEDSIGRTGPAMFTVISPSTSTDQALIFARRLRDQLETARVRHENQTIRLRASIGIAAIDRDTVGSWDQLTKLALERLERAASRTGQEIVERDELSITRPPMLPSDIERAVRTLESASPDRAHEILQRLLPFLRAACQRLNVELAAEAISQAVKGK
jgi:diguanylate cyclase (GGDEF)-like protein